MSELAIQYFSSFCEFIEAKFIKIEESKEQRKKTPDGRVLWSDGREVIVEIKESSDIYQVPNKVRKANRQLKAYKSDHPKISVILIYNDFDLNMMVEILGGILPGFAYIDGRERLSLDKPIIVSRYAVCNKNKNTSTSAVALIHVTKTHGKFGLWHNNYATISLPKEWFGPHHYVEAYDVGL